MVDSDAPKRCSPYENLVACLECLTRALGVTDGDLTIHVEDGVAIWYKEGNVHRLTRRNRHKT